MSSTPRLLEIVAVLLMSLVAFACGSVGEPRPPLLNIPERVQNLTARQTAEGIVLEWTWPRMTTEGVPLNDLARFEIYGFEVRPGDSLPDAGLFERESRPLAAIEGDALAHYGPGERVRLVLDAAPLMGRLLVLGVRAESRRGRSVGFSDLLLTEVIAPPAAPGKPSLNVERDAIIVQWPVVERASNYSVERRAGDSNSFEAIGNSASTEFRDAGYRVGETYAYRVRAIASAPPAEAEGPPSESVAITPQDVFAPEKPTGLREVATQAAVELSWEQNQEPDLAGYRVSRVQEGSEPVLIHDDLLTSPSYSDQNVVRGQEYLYQVTAVDQEGNESQPSETIRVRVPE